MFILYVRRIDTYYRQNPGNIRNDFSCCRFDTIPTSIFNFLTEQNETWNSFNDHTRRQKKNSKNKSIKFSFCLSRIISNYVPFSLCLLSSRRPVDWYRNIYFFYNKIIKDNWKLHSLLQDKELILNQQCSRPLFWHTFYSMITLMKTMRMVLTIFTDNYSTTYGFSHYLTTIIDI